MKIEDFKNLEAMLEVGDEVIKILTPEKLEALGEVGIISLVCTICDMYREANKIKLEDFLPTFDTMRGMMTIMNVKDPVI